jgi:hypothetical protein
MKPVEMGMNVFSKLGLIPLGPYHSLMYGRSLYFDINKSKLELDYNPKFSTKKMFQESYDWYLKNIESLKNNNSVSNHKKPSNESFLIFVKYFSKFLTRIAVLNEEYCFDSIF